MKIRFWGVRGSIPCPGPNTAKYGGNSACLELRVDDRIIVIDAGSGIRDLGTYLVQNELSKGPLDIKLFLSHTHWDHMMGFPFFAPAYEKGVDIHIHGVHPKLKERFEQQMDLIHFPITMDEMGSQITFHQHKSEEEFSLGPFTIRNKGLQHPGGSYSYRISSGMTGRPSPASGNGLTQRTAATGSAP